MYPFSLKIFLISLVENKTIKRKMLEEINKIALMFIRAKICHFSDLKEKSRHSLIICKIFKIL